ncbi:MAG: prepilin-type N-terminal cleavage/methylation domain-containing protein [Ideonella sp.]|nr:prepilin-type N-terminal cleavage/methylation domain-containing protein [Ideonella sp.]
MTRALQQGFTLIEVMVTVAIVAILASVALPAYTEYIRRGQLPEAFTNLSDYRVKMEQYYRDNRSYGTGSTCANATGTGAWNNFVPTGRRYFTYACTLTNSGQGYTVTATGSASRATGYDYTINQAGVKATTKLAGSSVTGCALWATKAGEC